MKTAELNMDLTENMPEAGGTYRSSDDTSSRPCSSVSTDHLLPDDQASSMPTGTLSAGTSTPQDSLKAGSPRSSPAPDCSRWFPGIQAESSDRRRMPAFPTGSRDRHGTSGSQPAALL